MKNTFFVTFFTFECARSNLSMSPICGQLLLGDRIFSVVSRQLKGYRLSIATQADFCVCHFEFAFSFCFLYRHFYQTL